jgi:hypothetical protein
VRLFRWRSASRTATRDSWSRQRRVIAKAEWTGGAANPRFVVIAAIENRDVG